MNEKIRRYFAFALILLVGMVGAYFIGCGAGGNPNIISELKNDNRRLEKLIVELNENAAESDRIIEQLNVENSRIRAELRTSRSVSADLARTNRELQETNTRAEIIIDQLRGNIKRLEETIERFAEIIFD